MYKPHYLVDISTINHLAALVLQKILNGLELFHYPFHYISLYSYSLIFPIHFLLVLLVSPISCFAEASLAELICQGLVECGERRHDERWGNGWKWWDLVGF